MTTAVILMKWDRKLAKAAGHTLHVASGHGDYEGFSKTPRETAAVLGLRAEVSFRHSLLMNPPCLPSTLASLAVGERARIQGIALPEDIRLRLLEMGLTEGVECRILRYAPLGDPMEIQVRGYCLSLRTSEARGVLVNPAD